MAEVIALTLAQCETLAKIASDLGADVEIGLRHHSGRTVAALLWPPEAVPETLILIDPDGCFYYGEDE